MCNKDKWHLPPLFFGILKGDFTDVKKNNVINDQGISLDTSLDASTKNKLDFRLQLSYYRRYINDTLFASFGLFGICKLDFIQQVWLNRKTLFHIMQLCNLYRIWLHVWIFQQNFMLSVADFYGYYQEGTGLFSTALCTLLQGAERSLAAVCKGYTKRFVLPWSFFKENWYTSGFLAHLSHRLIRWVYSIGRPPASLVRLQF